MRWKELTEAPIGDIYTHGDFSRPGSLRQDDLSLSTKKRQDKIKRILEKAPVVIDLHFVNLPQMVDVSQHIRNYIGTSGRLGFRTEKQMEDDWDIDVKINPNAINLVYVQNEGSERVPMTPWIIAHRLGHALSYPMITRIVMYDLLNEFSDKMNNIASQTRHGSHIMDITTIAKTFGTTRACREGLIVPGRVAEWFYDCFAQMCVIGDIKFNKAPEKVNDIEINEKLRTKIDNDLDKLKKILLQDFHDVLSECVGKALVF